MTSSLLQWILGKWWWGILTSLPPLPTYGTVGRRTYRRGSRQASIDIRHALVMIKFCWIFLKTRKRKQAMFSVGEKSENIMDEDNETWCCWEGDSENVKCLTPLQATRTTAYKCRYNKWNISFCSCLTNRNCCSVIWKEVETGRHWLIRNTGKKSLHFV